MRTVVIEAWPWVLAVEFRLMFARPILGSERAYLLFTFFFVSCRMRLLLHLFAAAEAGELFIHASHFPSLSSC